MVSHNPLVLSVAVMAMTVLPWASAFIPLTTNGQHHHSNQHYHHIHHHSNNYRLYASSTTRVYGFRQALKRRFSWPFFRKKRPEQDATVPDVVPKGGGEDTTLAQQLLEEEQTSVSTRARSSNTRQQHSRPVSVLSSVMISPTLREAPTESSSEANEQSASPSLIQTAAAASAATITTTSSALLLPSTTTTTTTTPIDKLDLLSSLDERIYSLPPLPDDIQLSELQTEFRAMLTEFTKYSRRDVLTIRVTRLRVLFQGIVASAGNPAVYRAFEVLFEDLYPVRVAGRLIIRQLQQVLLQSRHEHAEEVAAVVASTGLPKSAIEQARLTFLAIALRLNGDSYLTLEQLLTTGLTSTAVETLQFDSARAFLERIDTGKKGRLRFADMMLGLHQCAEEMCVIQDCDPAETVNTVMLDLVEHPPQISTSLDSKRERVRKRYDYMVECFRNWEELVPDIISHNDTSSSSSSSHHYNHDDFGDHGADSHHPATQGRRQARMQDVIRGCFVGAKNEQVVDALRVLYTDYAGLRLAGDLIYKLTASVMEGRRKRRAKAEAR